MAANECIPYYEPGAAFTGEASSAVTGKRFVALSANKEAGWAGLTTSVAGGNVVVAHAAAGAKALGVAAYDIASGDKGNILTGGVLPITADGAIGYGDLIAVGATGKAKTAVAGQHVVGVALANGTDGNDVPVFLGSAGGGSGGGTDLIAQTHIADPTAIDTQTGAATPAITAAVTDTTAASLTTVQALQVDYNKTIEDVTDLYASVADLVANQTLILDALEVNGILLSS